MHVQVTYFIYQYNISQREDMEDIIACSLKRGYSLFAKNNSSGILLPLEPL